MQSTSDVTAHGSTASGTPNSIDARPLVPVLNFRGARLTGSDTDDHIHDSPRAMPILLPNQWDPLQHIAIDIGGSLAKIVWFERLDQIKEGDPALPCCTCGALDNKNNTPAAENVVLPAAAQASAGQATSATASQSPENQPNDQVSARTVGSEGSQLDSGVHVPGRTNGKSNSSNSCPLHRKSRRAATTTTVYDGALASSPLVKSFLEDTGRNTLVKGGLLQFKMFEVSKLDECIEFIREIFTRRGIKPDNIHKQVIRGTGGGAHKFSGLFKEKLGIRMKRDDEMECLVTGLNFLVKEIPDEVFTYDERREQPLQHYQIRSSDSPSETGSTASSAACSAPPSDDETDTQLRRKAQHAQHQRFAVEDGHVTTTSSERAKTDEKLNSKGDEGSVLMQSPTQAAIPQSPDAQYAKPYLIVNIGSGVSIIKVTGADTYERVSGTSFGGGTFWGLLSLLTDSDDYDAMLQAARHGDNKNVDMLVSDIYGGNYSKIGLKGNAIASTFGKVFKIPKEERRSHFKNEDVARSLLYLVCNNVGQIAYLLAQRHGADRIFFSGFFIRNHPITMYTLTYAVDFWSKGSIKALFTRHEGYFGAMGAFLQQSYQKPREHRLSYAGASDREDA